MRTLYLGCGMGAAGDMLAAALIELIPNPDEFIQEVNALGIPGVWVSRGPSVKCGITGTHISVMVHGEEEESHDHHHDHEHGDHDHDHHHDHEHGDHDHDHHHDHEHGDYDHDHHHDHDHGDHDHHHGHTHSHSGMHDIEHIVRGHMALPESVQNDIMAVYGLIAEAESHAHGVPVDQIHFHEVGTMDAIADITMVCMLMNWLAPDEVVVSPVHVGSGQVRCAHGILPVPAPATAYILKDVPIYGGSIQGELCTPTGAALLKHFASRFGSMPVMKTWAIGYGMGKKDFEAANCVRALWGETEEQSEMMLELSCNVDDMTAEAVGFAMERLFEGGARDVYTIPIGMKKSRPGTLIRVMCSERNKDHLVYLMFKHTTTLGIRETKIERYTLGRRVEELETPYGIVRRKNSEGYGISRSKFEYEDIARIAREYDVSLDEVRRELENI